MAAIDEAQSTLKATCNILKIGILMKHVADLITESRFYVQQICTHLSSSCLLAGYSHLFSDRHMQSYSQIKMNFSSHVSSLVMVRAEGHEFILAPQKGHAFVAIVPFLLQRCNKISVLSFKSLLSALSIFTVCFCIFKSHVCFLA
jgi:hypothetical protein